MNKEKDKKKITIKDVAKIANVSFSTVSRALRNDKVVKKETIEKVVGIAKKYNYIPNSFAQYLKTQKSKIIGVIFPDILNPIFMEILHNIIDVCHKRGYSLLVDQSDYNPDKESYILNTFLKRNIDGLLIYPFSDKIVCRNAVTQNEIYTVLIDLNCNEKYFLNNIYVNHKKIVCETIIHMISLGHRNIGFIAGPQGFYGSNVSIEGYKDALIANGLKVNDRYIVNSKQIPEDAYEKTLSLLKKEPEITGIFLYGDYSAIGVYKAIKDIGYKIPEDISVISYDNIESSKFLTPPLTTINFPKKTIGRLATTMVIDKIENKMIYAESMEAFPKLIERESFTYARDNKLSKLSIR